MQTAPPAHSLDGGLPNVRLAVGRPWPEQSAPTALVRLVADDLLAARHERLEGEKAEIVDQSGERGKIAVDVVLGVARRGQHGAFSPKIARQVSRGLKP